MATVTAGSTRVVGGAVGVPAFSSGTGDIFVFSATGTGVSYTEIVAIAQNTGGGGPIKNLEIRVPAAVGNYVIPITLSNTGQIATINGFTTSGTANKLIVPAGASLYIINPAPANPAFTYQVIVYINTYYAT